MRNSELVIVKQGYIALDKTTDIFYMAIKAFQAEQCSTEDGAETHA